MGILRALRERFVYLLDIRATAACFSRKLFLYGKPEQRPRMTVIAHKYAKTLQVNLQKGAIGHFPLKIHQIFLTGDIPDRRIKQLAERIK